MNKIAEKTNAVTRRQALKIGAGALFAVGIFDVGMGATREKPSREDASPKDSPRNRVINIMNFLRAEEPRGPVDLMLPLREQMSLIKGHGFAATWLLQYNALVEGPFVEFLKAEMPENHEVGFWFEIDRKLCDAAGIEWRGRKDWGWDYHVPIAYLIGYTPDERKKLADAAVSTFTKIWGHKPRTVASWNLDSITLAYLSEHYGVEAFAVCRDQLATDGFTIWGAPIAGYFPSRVNAWSPALETSNQIHTPIFRLLGQDPVYYYDQRFRLANGDTVSSQDTMEPVTAPGQTESFVREFLAMTAHAPCLSFAYGQLGQENSFGWPGMSKGYQLQMTELARMQAAGELTVETMGDTGRWFRKSFSSTPSQAQVQLHDPFGHDDPAERSIWYQSRFYRANLHCRGGDFYLRDLTVYSDRLAQPYLDTPTAQHGIEQRMPAVLDGFHWSDEHVRAGGHFCLRDESGQVERLQAADFAAVREAGSSLEVVVSTTAGIKLHIAFGERSLTVRPDALPAGKRLALDFEWVPTRSALASVIPKRLDYRYDGFAYGVEVATGVATQTADGVRIDGGAHGIELQLAQAS